MPVTAEANRNVVSAGLARGRDRILAAMVVGAGKGRQRLAVGAGVSPIGVLNQGGPDFASISPPVWLRTADSRPALGLVVADGKLYRFDQAATMQLVPLNLPLVRSPRCRPPWTASGSP
ncbi:hypothetical protein GCM10027614_36620 [Micromonospora vulcania]